MISIIQASNFQAMFLRVEKIHAINIIKKTSILFAWQNEKVGN